jgi:hypothetical protein
MEKNGKISILKFGLKFENFEIYHENLKWKNWNFSFLKFGIFIFEIWNEIFCLYHQMEMKKNNWNEEIIYFVYATEIKLPIIPLYHPYHLCIPPYTTCASCGGIQLILAVGSFHTGPFPTVVWGGMVHRERAYNLKLLCTVCIVSRT